MMFPRGLYRIAGSVIAGLALLAGVSHSIADDASVQSDAAPPAATQPAAHPLLQELNQQTQALYKDVADGIVRVQLPLPTAAADDPNNPNNPLAKWAGQLDPEVRRQLEELQRRQPGGSFVLAEIHPTTGPSATTATGPHLIVMRLSGFTPNCMGMVIDDQGDLVIPHYVNKEAFDQPVPVALGNGQMASATFVGSDQQSDMTVLKLQNAKSKSLTTATSRPDDGSLLMILSLNPSFNRLAVWSGWEPDFAVLVTMEGQAAGFTLGGRYVSAATCKTIGKELVDHGEVRRAFLGVLIETVGPDDPQRRADATLGDTPAIRVDGVVKNSPADQAGIHPGDLILKLGTADVGDTPAFAAAIATGRGKTQIVLLRDGMKITVDVDLQVQ
jgi:S1-C subfamily serine protease